MKNTILIVEDESTLSSALRIKLKREGFEVIHAKNGEEGLQMAIQNKPNIILLDIIMPKMDGMTMLKELREDSWGKDAKVIMLTNLDDAEAASQSVTSGVTDYLVKSDWTLEDVVKKIKEKLV